MQGKKRDESIIADSDRYRGCYYGVVASARAAISGQRERHSATPNRDLRARAVFVILSDT